MVAACFCGSAKIGACWRLADLCRGSLHWTYFLLIYGIDSVSFHIYIYRKWGLHACCVRLTFRVYGYRAVTRSKFFQDDAILNSACASKLYTAGHWSTTRPAVFFLGTKDGNVEVWDLLDRTHEPSLVQNVTAAQVKEICHVFSRS